MNPPSLASGPNSSQEEGGRSMECLYNFKLKKNTCNAIAYMRVQRPRISGSKNGSGAIMGIIETIEFKFEMMMVVVNFGKLINNDSGGVSNMVSTRDTRQVLGRVWLLGKRV